MAAGAPQLLFANLMVASLMLNAFYALRDWPLELLGSLPGHSGERQPAVSRPV